jgi:hypothetical protein
MASAWGIHPGICTKKIIIIIPAEVPESKNNHAEEDTEYCFSQLLFLSLLIILPTKKI